MTAKPLDIEVLKKKLEDGNHSKKQAIYVVDFFKNKHAGTYIH